MINYLPNSYSYNRRLNRIRKQKRIRLIKLTIWIIVLTLLGKSLLSHLFPAQPKVIAESKASETVIEATPSPSPTISPSPSPTPLKSHSRSVESIIIEVFGEHTDKAMKLLQNTECGENKSLDPKAKNYNYNDAGEIDSIDYGVFQINNKWQKIYNEAFLYDPEINVRVAWNIYKRDGYSFKLWTCGRALGI